MDETLKNWSIFLIIATAIIVGIYYIFRNSAIGQLFGDIFGILDSGAAAMNEKLSECERDGFFSTKCGIGIGLILAGIGAMFFGLGKWLLGPAGDTKAGELWRSIKGRGVTTSDLIDIKTSIDTKVAEYRANSPDKWSDVENIDGGPELFTKLLSIKETHAATIKDLNSNNPGDAVKIAQAEAEYAKKFNTAKSDWVYDDEDNDNDDPEREKDADDIGELVDNIPFS